MAFSMVYMMYGIPYSIIYFKQYTWSCPRVNSYPEQNMGNCEEGVNRGM